MERSLPPVGATGLSGVLLGLVQTITILAPPVRASATTLLVAVLVALLRRSLAPVRVAGVRVLAPLVTVLASNALLQRPGPLQQHVRGLHGYFRPASPPQRSSARPPGRSARRAPPRPAHTACALGTPGQPCRPPGSSCTRTTG